MSIVYYAYYEPSVRRYYYYNTTSQETVWDYPSDGEVIDPETNELFPNPLRRIKAPETSSTPQYRERKNTVQPRNRADLLEVNPMDELKARLAKRLEIVEGGSKKSAKIENVVLPAPEPVPEINLITPTSFYNETSTNEVQETNCDIKPVSLSIESNVTHSGSAPNQPSILDEQPELFESSPIIFNPQNSLMNPSTQRFGSQLQIDTTLIARPRKHSDARRNRREASVKISLTDDDNPPLVIEIENDIMNFTPEPEPEPPKPEEPKRVQYVPPMNGDQPYLPANIQEEIHQFKIKEFAQSHFKKRRRGHIFRRTSVSIDSMVTFETEAISSPLLSSLPSQCEKAATKCFKFILDYMGVTGSKPSTLAAINIVRSVTLMPELRDEIYFQLIKQTQNVPNKEWAVRGWELFLIMASLFPSTRNSEKWIKSHIAHNMQVPDREISNIARFTYIRFSSRCAKGVPLEADDRYILEIPSHPKTASALFGVSLYEIMWGQRRTFPKCPIPYFLVQMTRTLISKGATKHEGIFRLPGNMRRVDEMVIAANNGDDVLGDAPLDDIASLMKRWFRDFADPIVPYSLIDNLMDASASNRFVEFAAGLPSINSLTLAYLIGFLQEMSKYESETRMGVSNLAMVFGPNVVQTQDDRVSKAIIDVGKSFLTELINKWDVSLLYPLP